MVLIMKVNLIDYLTIRCKAVCDGFPIIIFNGYMLFTIYSIVSGKDINDNRSVVPQS